MKEIMRSMCICNPHIHFDVPKSAQIEKVVFRRNES